MTICECQQRDRSGQQTICNNMIILDRMLIAVNHLFDHHLWLTLYKDISSMILQWSLLPSAVSYAMSPWGFFPWDKAGGA